MASPAAVVPCAALMRSGQMIGYTQIEQARAMEMKMYFAIGTCTVIKRMNMTSAVHSTVKHC